MEDFQGFYAASRVISKCVYRALLHIRRVVVVSLRSPVLSTSPGNFYPITTPSAHLFASTKAHWSTSQKRGYILVATRRCMHFRCNELNELGETIASLAISIDVEQFIARFVVLRTIMQCYNVPATRVIQPYSFFNKMVKFYIVFLIFNQ